MQCCGPLTEITTHADMIPVYLCQECGKQGQPNAFPEPSETPTEPITRTGRVRYAVASWLDSLAVRITPRD